MNRVPSETPTTGEVRPAGTGDWVSPAQAAGSRRTSWRNLFAGIWPVHRAILLGCVGAAALLALALVWYRQWAIGVASDVIAGPACRGGSALDSPDCSTAVLRTQLEVIRTPGSLLTLVCAALTAGAGVILGVSAFARDFEQRTQVLLLTQSVSRVRWWTAKTLVFLVPWPLAVLGLGVVASWSFTGVSQAFTPVGGFGDGPMDPQPFYLSALGLFIVGTVAVCTGVTIGILMRVTLGAILVASVMTAALVVGAEVARPHLVPSDRFVSASRDGGSVAVPADSWYQRNGYLDSDGREIVWDGNCSLYSTTDENTTAEEYVDIQQKCLDQAGIAAEYTDVIPADRFTQVRALWSGMLFVVSGLVLLAAFLRIRHRVL
ncbi:hypothetical protein FDO65_01430 [Nakamurella flava]|uniref:Uncharacterized protein n=1 Tax=Nakamurella flava TaxID=2576308 RepID=A0A4U6QJ06_9ACTN|nr:hypothetical protein [Nakamurella flava]TKV60407.1 hypothetical protein FDO65_01430 [Nakamurella flava]